MVVEVVKEKPTRTSQTNTKADAVLSMFDQISNDVLLSVQAKIDRRVAQKVKKLEEQINAVRPIQIMINEQLVGSPIKGTVHQSFDTLLHVVSTGSPVMLVGAAGTGKSHAAELVASSFELPFYAMSVGAQTSKSDLIGYMNAVSVYVPTVFRSAYENGGVFLLDEIDAGNSNVLIQLNAALANGYMSFPDGMVRKHKDFRFIASANTFGLGASRQYVGRNQLDAATLDRFIVLTWDIDHRLEETLAVGWWGKPWLEIVRFVRQHVQEQELRIVVSPRATQRGSLLLESGMDFNKTLHMALLSQFTGEVKELMHKDCHRLWREITSEMGDKPSVEETPVVTADDVVTGRYDWLIQLADMEIKDAYDYMFGTSWKEKVTIEKEEIAKIVVDNCSEMNKFELLKVHLVEDVPNVEVLKDGANRQAIYEYMRNAGWDFRDELGAWLASSKPNVTPVMWS